MYLKDISQHKYILPIQLRVKIIYRPISDFRLHAADVVHTLTSRWHPSASNSPLSMRGR